MNGHESKRRAELRAQFLDMMTSRPKSDLTRSLKRFGLERHLDCDEAWGAYLAMRYSVTRRRWQKYPEVLELLDEARDVLNRLTRAMAKAWRSER